MLYRYWYRYFIIHIITEDFIVDISDDVERWFNTSNYDENDERPLAIGKNKKGTGLFKDELGGRIIKEFCSLRAKTYAYITDDDDDDDDDDDERKKLKEQKNMQ